MDIGAATGQRAVPLKRIAKVQGGTAIAPDNLHHGSICVFGANGILARTRQSNTLGPTIIISRKVPVGKIYWSDQPCWANDATFFIDQSNARVDLRWLYYALQTLAFDIEPPISSLNRTQLDEMRLCPPDAQTQKQTANYLDMASAQWQQLIHEKQVLLALCVERRRTLINRATTVGLQDKAPLKDTGIIGIGAIPADWQCVPLKRLIHSLTSGPTLAALPVAARAGEFGVIRAAAIKGGHFDATQNHVLLSAHEFPVAETIQQNDLFIVKTGNGDTVGDLALADAEYPQFTFAENLFRLRVDRNKVLANWVYWVLLGDVGRMQIGAEGVERLNLSQSDILDWIIPLPPLLAQSEIVEYLIVEVNKLEELAQATQQSIDLLHERRNVLVELICNLHCVRRWVK